MFAVLAFIPESVEGDGGAVITFSGVTDNKGNAYVVGRMMTTTFPLNVVLMELAEQLETRGSWLNVNWVPRQQNVEADALTNGEFHDFDPARRVDIRPEAIQWILLPEMMAAGGGMVKELAEERQKRREERKWRKQGGKKKRRAREALRDKQPW